ncbi:hypothetical protein GGX14DRAFT_669561 [Mycena pura]|uniref:BTB domain-containing protein n=1 Tax=Mycena pura TaxID=153505 RepID=A0AAD6VSB9_9AGAR|nr:hypothetical protein GGX14DRAFT_669561 [Mycena pura]
MDEGTEADNSRRMESLWFEDGSIILQAGSIQYRVHRSILAMHSPVFKDMLAFPQPADSELIDGCPVVRLPDPEAEVTPFLRALYDPQFFQVFPARTTFAHLFGCLRLGHKYGVDYLRRRALGHLSSMFRTTLSEWDATGNSEVEDKGDRLPSSVVTWTFVVESVICAIQLAREVEALWVLPGAFYCLSENYKELREKIFHEVVYDGITANLSVQDQQDFLRGSDAQIASTFEVMRSLGGPPSIIEGCTSTQDCIVERLRVLQEAISDHSRSPLVVGLSGHLMKKLCPHCLAVLKQKHEEARQAFWDELPQMYGLPPWNELEQMKTDAIGTDLLI